MNIPWIEIIKSDDLYTVDDEPVYIKRGTLSRYNIRIRRQNGERGRIKKK